MTSFGTSRLQRGPAAALSTVLLVTAGLCAPFGAAAVAQEASATGAIPPSQFAICAVCHTTTTDGASSMGPNLRGVVGRKAGTLPGFQYSKPMRDSGIRWTPRELDSYLTDVSAKVPGTLMPFNGLPDSGDRQAVINYLKSLK
jgi:cytochrome c